MIGARIARNEDPRLLRGLGCFVADIHPPGVLQAAGLRSPHAHARIVSIDATQARALPGVPLVHADVPANRAARLVQRVGDPEGAFAEAAHVLTERLYVERSCASPIEARGVVADYDPRTGVLRAWISTQAPLPIKNGLARLFGLPEFNVEVMAPDIGGAFGAK